MKARGLGFALPPKSFEIDFADTGPSLHVFESLCGHFGNADPRRWMLETYRVDAHIVALCREVGSVRFTRPDFRCANLAALVHRHRGVVHLKDG